MATSSPPRDEHPHPHSRTSMPVSSIISSGVPMDSNSVVIQDIVLLRRTHPPLVHQDGIRSRWYLVLLSPCPEPMLRDSVDEFCGKALAIRGARRGDDARNHVELRRGIATAWHDPANVRGRQ